MKVVKNRIPDELFKEIFPQKPGRGLSSEQIHARLKGMITFGEF